MNYKKLKGVDYLVVHCSASPPDMDIGLEEITRWHRERNFFTVGYHYIIRRDGTLEHGRDHTVPGAHARGFNHVSLAICLVGGVRVEGKRNPKKVPEDNFTAEQKDALEALLRYLKKHHPEAKVLGHRDLPRVNKACPSFDVREYCNERGIDHGTEDTEAEGS